MSLTPFLNICTDLQDLLELTPDKEYPFHPRGLECKSSQETSLDTLGVTGKFGLGVQNEVEQRLRVLSRERTGHSKHPLPTTQEMTLHMNIARWSIPKSD